MLFTFVKKIEFVNPSTPILSANTDSNHWFLKPLSSWLATFTIVTCEGVVELKTNSPEPGLVLEKLSNAFILYTVEGIENLDATISPIWSPASYTLPIFSLGKTIVDVA